MASFTLVSIEPLGFIHVRACDEIKLLIYHSLCDLGHQVSLRTNRFNDGGIPILLGAHLLSESDASQLSADTIIVNTEQLAGDYAPWRDRILQLARRHRVWDYASANLHVIKAALGGEARVARLRLGYHPKLQTIPRSKTRKSQFVFFGSITPYRQRIFDSIENSERLSIKVYFGVYGRTRNAILSSCLAALNFHSQTSRILEWPRLLPLLANKVPCIALLHAQTIAEDGQLNYVLPASESDPTSALEAYFSAPELLDRHAEECWVRFRDERQAEFTQAALDCGVSSHELSMSSAACYPWKPVEFPWRIDPQWYANVYPWIANDPRDIETYHAQEGRFRQYHPSPPTADRFRQPLRLSADPAEATGLMAGQEAPGHEFGMQCAVVLHFYYPDTVQQFFVWFGAHLKGADFFITVADPLAEVMVERLAAEYGINVVDLRLIRNRGRDIPSKYLVFNEKLSAYDVCLFSHGKKSDYNWFYDHNRILAGSAQRVRDVCALFAADPALGLVFPDYLESHLIWIGWGGMRGIVDEMLLPFGCDTSAIEWLEFPAGGFFWARPMALQVMHSLRLDWDDLPEEPLALDGTLLHAIERMPCLSCEMMGLQWQKLARSSC